MKTHTRDELFKLKGVCKNNNTFKYWERANKIKRLNRNCYQILDNNFFQYSDIGAASWEEDELVPEELMPLYNVWLKSYSRTYGESYPGSKNDGPVLVLFKRDIEERYQQAYFEFGMSVFPNGCYLKNLAKRKMWLQFQKTDLYKKFRNDKKCEDLCKKAGLPPMSFNKLKHLLIDYTQPELQEKALQVKEMWNGTKNSKVS